MLWPHSAIGDVRRAAAGREEAGFGTAMVCARGEGSTSTSEKITRSMAVVRLAMSIESGLQPAGKCEQDSIATVATEETLVSWTNDTALLLRRTSQRLTRCLQL